MRKTLEASELQIPNDTLTQWQSMVDSIAEFAGVRAGLIMRTAQNEIEVLLASDTEGNPYHAGEKEKLFGSGLYCETVIKTKKQLLIPDALADPAWRNNPDLELNMVSYLGFPILLPDSTPFGTICILDNKKNEYSESICKLLDNFRDLIESHLELLYMNTILGDKSQRLSDYLDQLQALRGLISICAQCKSIRDNKGYWHAVEEYLIKHPDADFSHGYCPDCLKKALDEIELSRKGAG